MRISEGRSADNGKGGIPVRAVGGVSGSTPERKIPSQPMSEQRVEDAFSGAYAAFPRSQEPSRTSARDRIDFQTTSTIPTVSGTVPFDQTGRRPVTQVTFPEAQATGSTGESDARTPQPTKKSEVEPADVNEPKRAGQSDQPPGPPVKPPSGTVGFAQESEGTGEGEGQIFSERVSDLVAPAIAFVTTGLPNPMIQMSDSEGEQYVVVDHAFISEASKRPDPYGLIAMTRQDGEITFRGPYIDFFELAGVEEGYHASDPKEPDYASLNPSVGSLAQYDAQTREYDALKAQLVYARDRNMHPDTITTLESRIDAATAYREAHPEARSLTSKDPDTLEPLTLNWSRPIIEPTTEDEWREFLEEQKITGGLPAFANPDNAAIYLAALTKGKNAITKILQSAAESPSSGDEPGRATDADKLTNSVETANLLERVFKGEVQPGKTGTFEEQIGNLRVTVDFEGPRYLFLTYENNTAREMVLGFSVVVPKDGPIILVNNNRKAATQGEGHGTAALKSFEYSLRIVSERLQRNIEIIFEIEDQPETIPWLERNNYKPIASDRKDVQKFSKAIRTGEGDEN